MPAQPAPANRQQQFRPPTLDEETVDPLAVTAHSEVGPYEPPPAPLGGELEPAAAQSTPLRRLVLPLIVVLSLVIVVAVALVIVLL